MHRYARNILIAALLTSVSAPAFAADILIEEPVEIVPAVVGGWYMRGHIGMSNQYFDRLESDLFSLPFDFGWRNEGDFAAAPLVGGGIGYQFNDYFRADATVEWRGKSDFEALDWVQFDGPDDDIYTNEYTGKKSELVLMANGYYDIATFSGFTPYVGAGIGASYNKISGFRDSNAVSGGGAYAGEEGEWNLAWALHAGLGFQATERLTIDFGYSFISLGDAKTKQLFADNPETPLPANDGVRFNDIYSHDFKLGVRYAFN